MWVALHINLGIPAAGSGVPTIGYNSPGGLKADVGAILAGCVPAGIYIDEHGPNGSATSRTTATRSWRSPTPRLGRQVRRCGRRDAEARGRCSNLEQAGRRSRLPVVLSWDSSRARREDARGRARGADSGPEAGRHVSPICVGTTGEPKAVMITHTRTWWTAQAMSRTRLLCGRGDDPAISLLSHIAWSRCSPSTSRWASASLLYFAESLEKLGEALQEVRPTLFLGVPVSGRRSGEDAGGGASAAE